MAKPMIAFTRESGSIPQPVLPPAAVSAVTVPRECPRTPAREASTRSPNQPGSAFSTCLMSLTRSRMLCGTAFGTFVREHGGAIPSLHGNRVVWAWALM